MKRLIIITATLALIALPMFAADNSKTRGNAQNQKDFEKLIRQINQLDNQPAARQAGVAEAARQAGIPESRFDSKSGIAGTFLAEEIAKNTKKSAQQIKAQAQSENWAQVATANNQDLAALEQKLTRIHEAMLNPNAAQAGADANTATAQSNPNVTPANTANGALTLDQSIQSVNSLGQGQDARPLALNAIARETGLSRPQVEQAADQNKQMGLGDLFVAEQLSVKTKKSVSDLWSQHLSPKSWTDIIQENNQNSAQLESQLARVETAMRGGTSATTDTQRVREREQTPSPAASAANPSTTANPTTKSFDETAFQNSIQSLNSLGQSGTAQSTALAAISRETAVPLTQVQQAQQQNQGMGLGDLFVAQELSAKTKKSVDELWKAHLNQRTWAQVAADNNQDISSIQSKLARVEQSARDASK